MRTGRYGDRPLASANRMGRVGGGELLGEGYHTRPWLSRLLLLLRKEIRERARILKRAGETDTTRIGDLLFIRWEGGAIEAQAKKFLWLLPFCLEDGHEQGYSLLQ